MRKHQIVILSFALAIFALTWIGVYFVNRNNITVSRSNHAPDFPEYKTVFVFFGNSSKDSGTMYCETTYSVERPAKRLSDNPKSALGEYA